MVKVVVAEERGYFGGIVREPGDEFAIPLDLWNDAKRRPRWVAAADGVEAPIAAPKKAAAKAKPEPAPKADPFADAPEPEAVASEAKASLSPAPDWIAPGTEI